MAKEKGTPRVETTAGSVGVFLSWSGATSRAIAEALSTLIPNVFQDVTPFVSSNDVDAGSNWFGRITAELAATEFGVLCLTQGNLASQWIHFEAGALAKKITDRTRVVPYLHGVSPSDLSPPLSLFHGVKSDKAGTLHLLKSLNSVRPDPFEQSRLQDIYEKWEPDFAKQLANLPVAAQTATPRRSERELLEEVLARLRGSQDSNPEATIPLQHGIPGNRTVEPRLNKEALMVQLNLKIAEIKILSVQEPDAGKRSDYRAIVSQLESQLFRIQYMSI